MSTEDRLILTCDPGFADLALEEMTGADGHAIVAHQLAPGVFVIGTQAPFSRIASTWCAAPPVFVRHICPVEVVLDVEGAPGDLDRFADLARDLAGRLDRAEPFSVQTRILGGVAYKPFDVNQRMASAVMEAGGPDLDVRSPVQVVSVVVVPGEVYAGVSRASDNLSNWAGGMRRFAREPEQVSRAEFKLLEAIEVFGLDLPPRGTALDLGASPGGWTRVLRQRAQYVTAVDPGALDPRLSGDRGIRHLRMTAEAYLADEPDQFDIIANDMRMDGRDSARLMVAYAKVLYPHGWALMTLKLPERNRRPVLDHAYAILREGYRLAGVRQLFHNRSEVTAYLRPPA